MPRGTPRWILRESRRTDQKVFDLAFHRHEKISCLNFSKFSPSFQRCQWERHGENGWEMEFKRFEIIPLGNFGHGWVGSSGPSWSLWCSLRQVHYFVGVATFKLCSCEGRNNIKYLPSGPCQAHTYIIIDTQIRTRRSTMYLYMYMCIHVNWKMNIIVNLSYAIVWRLAYWISTIKAVQNSNHKKWFVPCFKPHCHSNDCLRN